MKNWAVLESKLLKEEFLWGEVISRGIEVFYPKIRVKTINPRARQSHALFPGYLFVNIEQGSMQFKELCWIPGSKRWVYFGEELAVVSENVINGIRSQADALNNNGGEVVLKRMKHGETIEIIEGPFTGYEAMFDMQLSGDRRVKVMLRFLNSKKLPLVLEARSIRRKK